MGKARSSRRMRNRKSRTKRVGGGILGPGSCLNCSPEKTEFKRHKYYGTDQDMGTFLRELSVDKINLLYNELNDLYEKATFITILAEIYKTEIPIGIDESITDLIIAERGRPRQAPEEAQALAAQPGAFGIAHNPIVTAPAQPPAHTSGRGNVKVKIDPLTGQPVRQPATKNGPTGGFINFGKHTNGGKSSRRHRRGRTLHKRRKSSKVRKTRHRHTHSRSRR